MNSKTSKILPVFLAILACTTVAIPALAGFPSIPGLPSTGKPAPARSIPIRSSRPPKTQRVSWGSRSPACRRRFFPRKKSPT